MPLTNVTTQHRDKLLMTLEEFSSEVYPRLSMRRVDAAKELAQYGITLTDISSLKKIFGISVNNQKPRATEEQIQQMIGLAEEGITHKEIGKRFNLSQTRVSFILRKRGVELQNHVPFTKIQDMKLRLLCERHTPWKDIASQLGMTVNKVKNHAYPLGLSNGRPSGWQKGNPGRPMSMRTKKEKEKEQTNAV